MKTGRPPRRWVFGLVMVLGMAIILINVIGMTDVQAEWGKMLYHFNRDLDAAEARGRDQERAVTSFAGINEDWARKVLTRLDQFNVAQQGVAGLPERGGNVSAEVDLLWAQVLAREAKLVNRKVDDPLLASLQPILEAKMSAWLMMWRKLVPGFSLADMERLYEWPIQPVEVRDFDPEVSGLASACAYSPDRSKCVDYISGDVDSALSWVDLKNHRWIQLTPMNGPSFHLDEVIWIDNAKFVVAECEEHWEPEGPVQERQAKISVYDLTRNRVTLFLGPSVEQPKWQPIFGDYWSRRVAELGIDY
jgi:hypothetical protein